LGLENNHLLQLPVHSIPRAAKTYVLLFKTNAIISDKLQQCVLNFLQSACKDF